MDDDKLDTEHSWRELKVVVVEILDALRITSPDMRNHLWSFLPQHLVLRELEFLRNYLLSLTPEAKEDFSTFGLGNFRVLIKELPAHKLEMKSSLSQLPASHTLAIGLIASTLFGRFGNRYGISPRDYNETIVNAIEQFDACSLRNCTDSFISDADLAVIRGELIEYVMLLVLKGTSQGIVRVKDPEYYSWLGSHEDEVFNVYTALKERGSVAPDLVRELVERASNPLVSGSL